MYEVAACDVINKSPFLSETHFMVLREPGKENGDIRLIKTERCPPVHFFKNKRMGVYQNSGPLYRFLLDENGGVRERDPAPVAEGPGEVLGVPIPAEEPK